MRRTAKRIAALDLVKRTAPEHVEHAQSCSPLDLERLLAQLGYGWGKTSRRGPPRRVVLQVELPAHSPVRAKLLDALWSLGLAVEYTGGDGFVDRVRLAAPESAVKLDAQATKPPRRGPAPVAVSDPLIHEPGPKPEALGEVFSLPAPRRARRERGVS